MRVLVLCFIASFVAAGDAQTTRSAPRPTSPPATAPAPAKSSSAASVHFTAAGLNNEDDLVRIYSGDFQSVQLDRGGTEFMLIISSYMTDFGNECKQFLPANKVEITQQVCNDAPASSMPYSPDGVRDVYGNRIQPTGCSGYHTEGTGEYADPHLYDAVNGVTAQFQANLVKNMVGVSSGKSGRAANPFTIGPQLTDQLVAVKGETKSLINANGCGSAGLKNFQANLIRFANGESPVKYAGATASAPVATSGGPPKDADYTRLLDDLVADNARGWMMNRYQPGSIVDPIVSHDPRGYPVRIMARYSYSGMQGRQSGRVTLSFKDGTPDCLYFSDAPDTCRAASQRVISAYQRNAYAITK